MLTVSKNSNAYEATVFFEPLMNDGINYWLWRSGIIPSGIGAYAENERIHKDGLRQMLRQGGLFCAAVPNIYRRFAGLEIPRRPGFEGGENEAEYDGGIAAYFKGTFGDGYFTRVDQNFDMSTALRWAKDTRAPVLLGKGYWGNAVHQQGHTALLLPSGYVMQSAFGEGLHWWRTIRQERSYWANGGVMVHSKYWIDPGGEELRRQRADWAKDTRRAKQ